MFSGSLNVEHMTNLLQWLIKSIWYCQIHYFGLTRLSPLSTVRVQNNFTVMLSSKIDP